MRKQGGILPNLLAILAAIFFAFPVYWMIATSLKTRDDIFASPPQLFPSSPTLDNYATAIVDKAFFDFFKNSLIVTVIVVVASILVAFLAATAVARFNFKFRTGYIVMLLAVQMVPFEALMIPMYGLLNKAGMVDKLPGVMIAYLALVLPFTIWTLRGYVANVPKDLEEAAEIDGCSRAQSFWKILFPLVAPGLVATSVFAFILAWNEYVLANVILLSPENQTLPLFLVAFQGGQQLTDCGGLMAASVLFALPVVVFFTIVQTRIQKGSLAGGVKG